MNNFNFYFTKYLLHCFSERGLKRTVGNRTFHSVINGGDFYDTSGTEFNEFELGC